MVGHREEGSESTSAFFRRAAAVFVVALVAVGCSSAVETADDSSQASDVVPVPSDAAKVREIVIAIPDEFPTLSTPWGYQAQTALVLRNIHEPLLDRDPVTADLIPGLATEWSQIDDVTWRFKLREGVNFHDGSPFNAEAAAFSINDTFGPEKAGEGPYAPISSRANVKFKAEVVDEFTVDIVSDSVNPILLGYLFTAGISSMEQLKERPETFDSQPVGTGPYRFVEWNRGDSYVIEANPDWWGLNDEGVKFAPSYDRVVFVIRPEVSSRIAALQAGEVDFAYDLPADECFSALGDECIAGPNPTVSYVRMDTPHPTLNDPRVKEALAISVDRELIGTALLGGATPASQLDVAGALGFVDDIDPFPYDVERAKSLLADARADGVDLDVEIGLFGRNASFAGDTQVLETLQASWSALGLNIKAEMLESAAYNGLFVGGTETYVEGRAALWLLRWPNDLFDAARTIAGQISCPGGVNIECHKELEQRAKDSQQLLGAERGLAMQEVLRDFNKDLRYFQFIPLNELRVFHGVASEVEYTPRPDLWVYAREFAPK